jgi:hypothetical protein
VKIGLESTTKFGRLKCWLLSRLNQVLGLIVFFIKVYPISYCFSVYLYFLIPWNPGGEIYCTVVPCWDAYTSSE